MPIIPLLIAFSYATGLFFTCLVFNKELIYYRTSLAGSLATKLDSECLIIATENYDLSVLQVTNSLSSCAALVGASFATLFTDKHTSIASYAWSLWSVFTKSMHVFFNLFMLAGLHVRMRPGSTGRFFLSVVFFGNAVFNLLTIGSLFFSTPCRAAWSLYPDSKTIDVTQGIDGVYSAESPSDFSDSIKAAAKKGFFSKRTLWYTLGIAAVVVSIWAVRNHFYDPFIVNNGVSMKAPRGEEAWREYKYRSRISHMESTRFARVGVPLTSINVDPVTGWYPVCYYYRNSFLYDFKRAYLAFHHLGIESPVNWVQVFLTKCPGSAESYRTAWTKIPYLSFQDPTTLVVNLLQESMYAGLGVIIKREF